MGQYRLKSKLAQDCDEDFEDFFNIKSDTDNIKWSGFLAAPEKKSFRIWYSGQIQNPGRDIYLVYIDKNIHAVAFFYIDYCENKSFQVPSGVIGEFTRQGIGTWVIQEAEKIAKERGCKVHFDLISEFNIGSSKRYEKLGFTKTTEFEIRNVPLAGGEQKFYKWIKKI